NAADERPSGALEVLQVDAVGPDFYAGVLSGDFRADDPYVRILTAANHGSVASGDHVDHPVFARQDESPAPFGRGPPLVKPRGFWAVSVDSRHLRYRTRLITLCHRSLSTALSVHAGRMSARRVLQSSNFAAARVGSRG